MIEVPLTQGQVALVDSADSWVLDHKWCAGKYNRDLWYAVRSAGRRGNRRTLFMHRVITQPPEGLEVHHKNGNGLDNRRSNLVVCSRSKNAQGFQKKRLGASSKYRGVGWDKGANRWRARIVLGDKLKFIGLFHIEEEAARAYDQFSRDNFGEFAHLNFPI